MKGLLIKDFKLLKNMRNSMVLILLISVMMAAYTKKLSFIIMYLSLLGATFTISTLSYDEFENGYAFLLSLPVTRRGYVKEKFCFGLILSVGAWLSGTVIAVAMEFVRKTASVPDILMEAITLLPSAVLLLSVMLPLRLKFGSEKGRIVMIGAAGLVFGLFYLAAKLGKELNLNLGAVEESLAGLGEGVMTAAGIAVGIAILFISYRISISIMKKKEF